MAYSQGMAKIKYMLRTIKLKSKLFGMSISTEKNPQIVCIFAGMKRKWLKFGLAWLNHRKTNLSHPVTLATKVARTASSPVMSPKGAT
jgi:hypothetical protein